MTDEALHKPLIGQPDSRQKLNTPALILDLDALERNIARMAKWAAEQGIALRPHTKTHKSAHIARLQRAAGAIGFCCAKLGEAEALAANGITDGLLLTSPIVAAPAIERLIALNLHTTNLLCVVDHPSNIAALAAAAQASGKPLAVLIDIDPGIHRTGVASPQAAAELFRAIAAQPSLTYKGVQFYCGREQHIPAFADRRAAIQAKTAYLQTVLTALADAGAPRGIVTGGGSGTHRIDAELATLNELQPGSYAFMDSEYADCDLLGNGEPPYEFALQIDTTVISANTPGLVTVDAGIKALATDAGIPRVLAGMPPDTQYLFMGDEHAHLIASTTPALGARITLTASHCDPTVNLYDTYHVVRGATLIALWPVDGRGRSR